ncbi:MAG: hypothetical protein CVT63_01095 [Candidatus Anoxymicrobium japonicum]|uniref:Uncharacterized protein n=1 Tax=Candidatus Anoxymicrobium japonicum TaxID=2013648 RepID=A0A2N3G7R9_9ACTN|nr:MAG: hypothetical protein CVT63_01095 [Candidatus Anoxymicrobium japonicum]
MVFVGKIAYLTVFPGMLFIFLAGLAAHAVASGVRTAISGSELPGAGIGHERFSVVAGTECIVTGGSFQAVMWVAPVLKILALSWVSCIILGFLKGDLALLYALLLMAGATDVFAVFLSQNPRVCQTAWPEAASLLAWAIPFATALAALVLRTGEVSVSGLIRWQVANGVLAGASAGGAAARAGALLALASATAAALALARLRPLGRGYKQGAPGGLLDDVSGPPLAFFAASESAMLFVVPLVLVALFFAGPCARWFAVVFWGLKILGVLLLLALIDTVFARASSTRALVWGAGGAGGLALIGLVLTWIGVSA